jgi:2-dehydro-3-deoxygalactonokinase
MTASLLACDWGTTNLRAWTFDGEGAVIQMRHLPLGVAGMETGQARARFLDTVAPAMDARGLPAILCGMIGSNLGWQAVPYLDCPAALDDLAEGLLPVGPDVRIVPGMRCAGVTGAPDVMRGEETQLFGWMAADPSRRRGRHLVCQPGTHAKWMLVEDGRLVRFVTVMTGELFSVLSAHSILRTAGHSDDPQAFALGVAAAGDGDGLSARLFSARSRIVGGGADPAGAGSYLSGLLIGADIASAPRLLGAAESMPVTLLGEAPLCDLYARALRQRGVAHSQHDGQVATAAGLYALHQHSGQGRRSSHETR